MPAFDTPTKVPLSWVNLRHGQVSKGLAESGLLCVGCPSGLPMARGRARTEHAFAHPLSLPLTHSHTHSLSLSLSLTHTHTRT